MPLKIKHPKNNQKIKQKLIIIQGRCDNAAQVTGELKKNGVIVPGGQKLGGGNKQWGYKYQGLANGDYEFTVSQTNSPVTTDSVTFSIESGPPPSSGSPPTVTSPGDAEEVPVVFYPYGVSSSDVSMNFSGPGGSTGGTVTQPDSDGNWSGQIDGIDSWPSGSGNLYTLSVSNSTGPTNVNNLTITPPPPPTPTV
jgi:hypothetical protein